MVNYILRLIEPRVREALAHFPAVGLVGARQVGKTTLARALGDNFIYLDLEDDRDRAKLEADARFFLNQYNDRCVILDEVQQMPEIFRLLRGMIDENRRPGRFILLGSASPELLRQSSESLAGRIAYLELSPFNLLEIQDFTDWKTHWLLGGFPEALQAANAHLSHEWRRNFIRSYLERDLPALGLSADPAVVRRFWQMLAGENGGIWQAEKFARSLGLSGATVKKYLNFLENAFLVTSLEPWFPNVSKRIVKSPKIYQSDSGILHTWLDIRNMDELLGSAQLGASWEGYVLAQIKSIGEQRLGYYFYRTHQGAECDLVLVRGGKPVAAIEIKFSSIPRLSPGFYHAQEDLAAPDSFVIIPETAEYELRKNVVVTSLDSFLKNHLPRYL